MLNCLKRNRATIDLAGLFFPNPFFSCWDLSVWCTGVRAESISASISATVQDACSFDRNSYS